MEFNQDEMNEETETAYPEDDAKFADAPQAGFFVYDGQVMVPHGNAWASNGILMREFRGEDDGLAYVLSENEIEYVETDGLE